MYNQGGKTSKYSKLKKGTRQGYRAPAYLFILVLEDFFGVTKSNKKINGLKIFEYKLLNTTYAYDTTFFLEN